MQRILSVETCRSSGQSSEFITKRLCCSVLLSIAFFSIIGGFLLGRYVTDKAAQRSRDDLLEATRSLFNLTNHMNSTIHDALLDSTCTWSVTFVKDFEEMTEALWRICNKFNLYYNNK